MQRPIFITGTGTGVGKTIAAAIVAEILQADYWKPIQAGFADGTDTVKMRQLLSGNGSVIHPETHRLALPSSPHIAAREEGIKIDLQKIYDDYSNLSVKDRHLVIEGAGGIMVPLNENEFMVDLVKKLDARVILVSRNYLGSINHSLLTASVCKQRNLDVIGWIFNDQYLHYEDEIAHWSGYPNIGSVRFTNEINKEFIKQQAKLLKDSLMQLL